MCYSNHRQKPFEKPNKEVDGWLRNKHMILYFATFNFNLMKNNKIVFKIVVFDTTIRFSFGVFIVKRK